MSFGNSKTNSSSQSSGTSNNTTTPNNLPYVQQGWTAAQNGLNATNGNSGADANSALNLINTGADAASNAALTGLNTAGQFATLGAPNGGNADLNATASGANIGNNNPNFGAMVKQLGASLQPQVDGPMGAAGRYGSGADANAYNSALTNESGQLAYTNYNQSIQDQLAAADQVSTNDTNSNNSMLAALGLIPNLGAAATGAGAAGYAGATAPTNTFAQLMSLLGTGGGTNTGATTGQTSGNSSTTSAGFNGQAPTANGTSAGGNSLLSMLMSGAGSLISML